MSKKLIFRFTLIVSIVMMMFGGAYLQQDCKSSGAIILSTGVALFFASPFISMVGRNDEDFKK